MAEFLQIYESLRITPSQFFDESKDNPVLLQTAIEELWKLNGDEQAETIVEKSAGGGLAFHHPPY